MAKAASTLREWAYRHPKELLDLAGIDGAFLTNGKTGWSDGDLQDALSALFYQHFAYRAGAASVFTRVYAKLRDDVRLKAPVYDARSCRKVKLLEKTLAPYAGIDLQLQVACDILKLAGELPAVSRGEVATTYAGVLKLLRQATYQTRVRKGLAAVNVIVLENPPRRAMPAAFKAHQREFGRREINVVLTAVRATASGATAVKDGWRVVSLPFPGRRKKKGRTS